MVEVGLEGGNVSDGVGGRAGGSGEQFPAVGNEGHPVDDMARDVNPGFARKIIPACRGIIC